ncbi:UMP kinase [Candidatus Marinamargulisbacteria bacterium SCGC AG-410-N11]|nr:UMP kinase [Candidatus Marinamargulisbacteria bacterium SCGC AG-410-N11]
MFMSKYNRVLLKLSGEAFKGSREYGIDPQFLNFLAKEIQNCLKLNIECGIVIGGGNIFRGIAAEANGMDRVTADYTGMLATIMNALALKDALSKLNVETRVQTAIEMKEVAEPFILSKAIRHLEKKRVVIFAGGTGNPYFTTDTTAALRAAEIRADAILKATKVDGVYDSDPQTNSSATLFSDISYLDVINKKLKVMDTTALSLSMDNAIPIYVFNLNTPNNLFNILSGKLVGTRIS